MDKINCIDLRDYIRGRPSDLYKEYFEWKSIIRNFLRSNNIEWEFRDHRFYIDDRELLLKFKLIYG